MSRFKGTFEGTTCDSCGVKVNDTEVVGWGELVVWRGGGERRLDLCPLCATYVMMFIDEECERDYKHDKKREP